MTTTHRPTAKPKLKETPTEESKDKPRVPLWKQPSLAMHSPCIIPEGTPLPELKERLKRMKVYRSWALSLGLAKQVLDVDTLKLWLVRGGYDHKLSEEVFS